MQARRTDEALRVSWDQLRKGLVSRIRKFNFILNKVDSHGKALSTRMLKSETKMGVWVVEREEGKETS